MPLAYLGTPYTLFPGGLEEAFNAAATLTARLLNTGTHYYCPIVHCHPLTKFGLAPNDPDIWIPFNTVMMEKSDTLIVAHLTSWETSQGLAGEIAYFEQAKKPIFDLNPETLTMVKRR